MPVGVLERWKVGGVGRKLNANGFIRIEDGGKGRGLRFTGKEWGGANDVFGGEEGNRKHREMLARGGGNLSQHTKSKRKRFRGQRASNGPGGTADEEKD